MDVEWLLTLNGLFSTSIKRTAGMFNARFSVTLKKMLVLNIYKMFLDIIFECSINIIYQCSNNVAVWLVLYENIKWTLIKHFFETILKIPKCYQLQTFHFGSDTVFAVGEHIIHQYVPFGLQYYQKKTSKNPIGEFFWGYNCFYLVEKVKSPKMSCFLDIFP